MTTPASLWKLRNSSTRSAQSGRKKKKAVGFEKCGVSFFFFFFLQAAPYARS